MLKTQLSDLNEEIYGQVLTHRYPHVQYMCTLNCDSKLSLIRKNCSDRKKKKGEWDGDRSNKIAQKTASYF